MELLSLKLIETFDYPKTKRNVEEYLEELVLIKYKYMNIMPPSTAIRIFDIQVQSSKNNESSIEKYLILKEEYEEKYKTKMDEIEMFLLSLSRYEVEFFKGHLINNERIETFTKQFRCGIDKVHHIKASAVIKFALIIGVAVEK